MGAKMRFFGFLFLISILGSSSALADPPPNQGWEKIRDEDGVLVHAREVEGSRILEFRGEGLVSASIAKILSVILDQDRNLEWTAMMLEGRYIKQLGPSKWEVYQRYDGPFPTSDRDFVMDLEVTLGKDKRRVDLIFTSKLLPNYPEFDCCVRANLIRSYFSFEEAPNGQTLVISEIQLDPRGWIPKWVVNLVQKDWESDNFAGLRKQVKKEGIEIHPLFKDW